MISTHLMIKLCGMNRIDNKDESLVVQNVVTTIEREVVLSSG